MVRVLDLKFDIPFESKFKNDCRTNPLNNSLLLHFLRRINADTPQANFPFSLLNHRCLSQAPVGRGITCEKVGMFVETSGLDSYRRPIWACTARALFYPQKIPFLVYQYTPNEHHSSAPLYSRTFDVNHS